MKQITYEQAMTMRREGKQVTLWKPIRKFGNLQLDVIDDLIGKGAFFTVDGETEEKAFPTVHEPKPENNKTRTGLDIEKMQKLRDEGMTIEAIAQECGCSNPTVSRYTKPIEYDVGKMQALRNAHWSVKMIADEMNCSESAVKRLTHRPAKEV